MSMKRYRAIDVNQVLYQVPLRERIFLKPHKTSHTFSNSYLAFFFSFRALIIN